MAVRKKSTAHPRSLGGGVRVLGSSRELLSMLEEIGTDEPDIAPALAALIAYIKNSTSSVEAATKSLKGAGILDRKGRVHKRFKP